MDTSDGVALFTDGSCNWNTGHGGWGAIVVDPDLSIDQVSGHSIDTTNNQMELEAAIQGLEYIHEQYGAIQVLVFSDSQYMVLGCNDRTRKRNKNKPWWKRLDKAIELHVLTEFEHVRGHSGDTYNEMADQLAAQARKRIDG